MGKLSRITWRLWRTPGMHRVSALGGQEMARALGPASWDLWSTLFARLFAHTGSKLFHSVPCCTMCQQRKSRKTQQISRDP